jgi:hypothetical protein
MFAAHRWLPCIVAVAAIMLALVNPRLRADVPIPVREFRIQRVGDTTYFHVRLERPADFRAPRIEAGPYSEAGRRKLTRLPQLVPQDGLARAVYQRLDVPHFRPTVGFSASDREAVPIQGLEFIGQVGGTGKAKLLLMYPNGEEAATPAGAKGGRLSRIVHRATWAEALVELDMSTAKVVPTPAIDNNRRGRDDLQRLWAEAQAARLAVLEVLAPEFGFYGFACAATARKYGVPDPVLEAERPKEEEKVHRRLFELTTGAAAITQSLAMRRVLGTDSRDRGERNIDVTTVRGIDIAEHPWEKMMGDKRPAAEPLARLVPHDNYYLHFRDVRKLIELGDLFEQWGTIAARAYEGQSRDYHLKERCEQQLCLRSTSLGKTLGPLVIRGVAITGSDPYVREGSDVTLIFHVADRRLFLVAVGQFLDEARRKHGDRLRVNKEDYHGVTIERFVTPLREVSLHRAFFGDFVVYSNSPVGLRRVLDVHQARLKSLWASPDFQYMRTAFPLGDKDEDGFGFLSDAFLRQLVGPVSKIKEQRRLEALTSLAMVTHGAMFSAYEMGKLPANTRELLAGACLKPEQVYVPEGKGIAWDSGRQVAVSDVYNTLRFATPLVELPLYWITAEEKKAYLEFREDYLRLWQRFYDPVGIRFSFNQRRIRAEVYVLPLVNIAEYDFLRAFTGGGTTPLRTDKLPSRSLVQIMIHLSPPWPIGQEFGNWALIRLDDNRDLSWLLEQWVRQDLDLEARKALEPQLPKVFRLPITVGVSVGNDEALTKTLQEMEHWGPYALKTWKYRAVPIRRLKFGPDSNLIKDLNRLANAGLSKLTIYHARIDDGWFVSLSKAAIKDEIDRAVARKEGKGPKGEVVPINSSLYLAPQAAVQAGDALRGFLEWETHKRALPNNALWYALYRSNLVAEDASEAAMRAVALKYLGFVPVSPDDSRYRYDRRMGEVINLRHGSLRRPQLHAGPRDGSPLAGLLEQFPRLRADVRFREDGLHAIVTIDRKTKQ